jgi:hypothetical protein
MEPVALVLTGTFLVMVVAAGLAMMRQRPPAGTYTVRCPEDGQKATVKALWNGANGRHTVVACDHRGSGKTCHEGCLAEVDELAARPEPTRVML